MDLLSNVAHFLVDFHDVLALSAMHTYFTTLPLSPKDSTLYKQYGVKLEFADYATAGGLPCEIGRVRFKNTG